VLVMIAGLLFQAGQSFFVSYRLFAAALANGLRGVGWAGLNTGGYSLLALIAPKPSAARLGDVQRRAKLGADSFSSPSGCCTLPLAVITLSSPPRPFSRWPARLPAS
jgi:hypothetical protein